MLDELNECNCKSKCSFTMFKICFSPKWLCCLNFPSVIVVFGINLFSKRAVMFKNPNGQNGSYFDYSVKPSRRELLSFLQ
jgi:hypothetical protein